MYYISMLISFKLNFMLYKIEKKCLSGLIKLRIYLSRIIYVIVTNFLVIQYIFIIL